jgi:isoleucyl-tRNA synthetase
MTVVNKYGADALRLYLINSPVVRGEPLAFKEAGVFAVVKDVFLPWYNAYRFLVQNALRYTDEHGLIDLSTCASPPYTLIGLMRFRHARPIPLTRL